MKNKADNPSRLLGEKRPSDIIELYFDLSHLKQIYRQGWLLRGIPPERCESVAEHSCGVALLALFLAPQFPDLDALRLLELALLHDFGEIDAGDITPAEGISIEEKRGREQASFSRVLRRLRSKDRILSLFAEYEAGTSPEARFIRQLEKVEMALQAAVYQQQGFGDLGEFLDSAESSVTAPELKSILDDLRRLMG